MDKTILHIDMNSYFASVEQQANPFLRGKPIVVSGDPQSRTVIAAASREAKKFGVKTGMAVFEAKKLCPNLFFVLGDPDKYIAVTKMFLKIFKEFTEKVEVFSIDEAFLDITDYVLRYKGGAKEVALKIKEKIRNEAGEWVSCSIGVSYNKLLAKLGSDLQKPDGLVFIDKKNVLEILDKLQLQDFCGLGPRIEKRLNRLGIKSVIDLRNASFDLLKKEFGNFYAHFLSNASRGIDYSLLVPYFELADPKSMGHSYTLPQSTASKELICKTLLKLCEKVGRRLRQGNFSAKTFVYYLRYDDFSHIGFRKTVKEHLNDGYKIYKFGEAFFRKCDLRQRIRLVGISSTNLLKNFGQWPLFSNEQKQKKALIAMDKINDRFGEFTVKRAFLNKTESLGRKSVGFGGAKRF